MVLLKVLTPAFFARGDMATPVKIGMITLALNFGLNLLFNAGIVAPAGIAPWLPRLEHIGPPLATSLAAMFNLGCLGVLLVRRGHLVAERDVLRDVGYDPEVVTGWAFGFGAERIALSRYEVDDVRRFIDSDPDFLEQLA